MTEQETMQGLRACWEYKDCSKCPFVLELNDCHSELAHEAYKTIERLRAENAALRERLEKAVDKTIVSEMLAKYFDCPCNFSPLDEEMWAYCRDNCVDDDIECWIRVINKKCAELKGEKE